MTLALDAGALIGLLDPRDPHHRAVAAVFEGELVEIGPVVHGFPIRQLQQALPQVLGLGGVLLREARQALGARELQEHVGPQGDEALPEHVPACA